MTSHALLIVDEFKFHFKSEEYVLGVIRLSSVYTNEYQILFAGQSKLIYFDA